MIAKVFLPMNGLKKDLCVLKDKHSESNVKLASGR